MQTVTAADLQPAGWICESCQRPFEVGDLVYGELVGMTGPDIVETNYHCVNCHYDHGHDPAG
jgi:hypothetical protein